MSVKRKGRPKKYTTEELALAYELRTWGASWKNIARGLCRKREVNAARSIREAPMRELNEGAMV